MLELDFGRSKRDKGEQDSGDTPPSRARTTTRRRTKQFWKETCGSLVAMGNMVVAIVSDEDALSDEEMTLLTDALVAECSTSERIGKWLERTSGVAPHVLLVKALISIILPRAQRRGIIPTFNAPPVPDNWQDLYTTAREFEGFGSFADTPVEPDQQSAYNNIEFVVE